MEAVIPVVSTLLGVLVGWGLSRWNARDERKYREHQTLRERQEAAAAGLDQAALEAMAAAPTVSAPADEMLEPLVRTQRLLNYGWTRASVLTDPEIDRRMRALHFALVIAESDCRLLRREPVNPWPISVGFKDLRRALAAFQRREEPPAPNLPSADEFVAISSSAPTRGGFAAIFDEIAARELSKAERRTQPE